jgi:hypothetical protein
MTPMRTVGEPAIPGKITVRAGNRKVVLAKHAGESARHVLLKALVFGLYVADYPELVAEPRFSGRYRPDLLQLNAAGEPVFWAECGATGHEKLAFLARAYPSTHIVVAKQVARIDPLAEAVSGIVDPLRRMAPLDLVNVPADAERFIGQTGKITVAFGDVALRRFEPGTPD